MFKQISKAFVLSFLLLGTFNSVYARTVLTINNQKDFDEIQSQIKRSIISGETDIQVLFRPGSYVFKKEHLVLKNINASDVSIHIIGNDASIIPQGFSYHTGDSYIGEFAYGNSWTSYDNDVPVWSQVEYADGLVEVVNESTSLCRLRSNNSKNYIISSNNSFILLTHWYKSSVYKVDKIEGDYIYFIATNLSHSSLNPKGFNINNDYYFYKTFPRFRLCNEQTDESIIKIIDGKVVLPHGITEVYEGRITSFLVLADASFHEFVLSGFNFIGNRYHKDCSFIFIDNVTAEMLRINDCIFVGLQGNPIAVVNTDNVCIDNNSFKNCYLGGIISGNNSSKTIIKNNTFDSIGLRMQNTFAVICRGSDYIVKDNTLCNYGYGGIAVGVWNKAKQEKPCKGVIENNKLTFTHDYSKEMQKNGIMDGAAIYLWTKNDGAIIRNNIIDGFSGAGGNCGIMCDDGAYGFSLIGNIITNIDNCYSISSRRVAVVEESQTPGTGIVASNINNTIRDNIVDCKFKFVGNERGDNGCVMGNNYMLMQEDGVMPECTISNVTEEGSMIPLTHTGYKRGRIGLSRQSYKQLRKSGEWRFLKKFVVRKNK